MLRHQDELHKELLAKELRFQEELLTRKTREETAQLKKAYAEDLARNVNAERTAILVRLPLDSVYTTQLAVAAHREFGLCDAEKAPGDVPAREEGD